MNNNKPKIFKFKTRVKIFCWLAVLVGLIILGYVVYNILIVDLNDINVNFKNILTTLNSVNVNGDINQIKETVIASLTSIENTSLTIDKIIQENILLIFIGILVIMCARVLSNGACALISFYGVITEKRKMNFLRIFFVEAISTVLITLVCLIILDILKTSLVDFLKTTLHQITSVVDSTVAETKKLLNSNSSNVTSAEIQTIIDNASKKLANLFNQISTTSINFVKNIQKTYINKIIIAGIFIFINSSIFLPLNKRWNRKLKNKYKANY